MAKAASKAVERARRFGSGGNINLIAAKLHRHRDRLSESLKKRGHELPGGRAQEVVDPGRAHQEFRPRGWYPLHWAVHEPRPSEGERGRRGRARRKRR